MAIPKGLGYEDTIVNGLELYRWSRLTGRTMLAPNVSHGQVSVVAAATRTIRVSAGQIFGHTIFDDLEQEDRQLPEVVSGSQYFLIVRAAEWGTTNNSSIKVIAGTSERVIPPFEQNPGTRADTPLALVRITKDQPLPTEIVDLRLIAEEPGVYTIFDDLALQLADRPGVQCYNPNTQTLWSRVYNTQQQRVWIPIYRGTPGWTVYDTSANDYQYAGHGHRIASRRMANDVDARGRAKRKNDADFVASGTGYFLMRIPAGHRPAQEIRGTLQGRNTANAGYWSIYRNDPVYPNDPDFSILRAFPSITTPWLGIDGARWAID